MKATEQALKCVGLEAGADLSSKQYYFVKVNTDSQVVVAGDGEAAVGVLQTKPDAAGRAGQVAIGGITKVLIGATLAAGDSVASDGNGKAAPATTGEKVLGTCIVGGAAGEIGSMLFQPRHSAA
jgi:hypothetical protein